MIQANSKFRSCRHWLKCKTRLCQQLLIMGLFIFGIAASDAEVYTWTDSNGRVHYAESVPPEYASQAKAFTPPPINAPKPEPEVQKQNRQAFQNLRRQNEKNRTASQQPYQDGSDEFGSEPENTLTLEWCRDHFVTVKDRTACFRRVNAQP